ncbi:hypothetical protein UlMin_014572 [Ulmus minor]
MGRGVSCGGGQSSLGYLFGDGENASKTGATPTQKSPVEEPTPKNASPPPPQKLASPSKPTIDKDIPAGIPGNKTNNYLRAEGQNCGNFITDRPSTKVHAAPGGGSSLGYLFGDGGK